MYSLKMLYNLAFFFFENDNLAIWFIGWLSLWEEMTCVHGFPLGGASFYLDRTLWLAKYTSSSFAAFIVQLFQVVLMKLSFESETYKLKGYESRAYESQSYETKSHGSEGI